MATTSPHRTRPLWRPLGRSSLLLADLELVLDPLDSMPTEDRLKVVWARYTERRRDLTLCPAV